MSAPVATRSATSRRSGRSGTASIATPSATSGVASRRRSDEFASRVTGSADLYEQRWPSARGVDQLRHRPRRVHPGRPRVVQRQTQRGQRRAQQRRRVAQPLVELWRRRPHRRPGVLSLRARQQRNFLATLLLSQGVPMLLHGDETRSHPAGEQQHLCAGFRAELARLVADRRSRSSSSSRELTRLRRSHPTFRRARFFDGRPVAGRTGRPFRTSRGSPLTVGR